MRQAIFLVFISLACGAATSAQDNLERFKPKQPPPLARPPGPEQEPEETAPAGGASVNLKVRGIVFVSALPQFRPQGVTAMDGVNTEAVPMLNHPDFQARMAKYLGRPLSMELVDAIGHDAIAYFKDHDRPVVRVISPEQDVTNGMIQFLVTEGRLGEVRVAGNRWFKSSLFTLRAKPGDPIIMSPLESTTAFYDRNPFRSVTAEMSPGKNPSETDITLEVRDKFPLRVFAGYDNAGVESTGEDRLFAGFNYGNLFGLAQELSYQFSSSVDFDQLLAHSATWTIPLPWHDVLQFSGVYSESRPDIGNDFDLRGTSWQVGGRYVLILPQIHHFTHELAFGYDFKYTDNNLQFGGEQVFDTPVEISEFSLAYSASLPDRIGRSALSLAVFWSPGGMSTHNDDESFEAARQGSHADYVYGTMGLDRITKLPLGMTWSLSARGQVSDGNLQATEQFLLGGQSTVRGYPELVAAGDEGIVVRNEVYSPSFSIARLVGIKNVNDQFQVLAFYDYGRTSVHDPLEGEDHSTELQSFGLGARWQIRDNLSVHFDYGWQINDIGLEDNSRAHFGVTASF